MAVVLGVLAHPPSASLYQLCVVVDITYRLSTNQLPEVWTPCGL